MLQNYYILRQKDRNGDQNLTRVYKVTRICLGIIIITKGKSKTKSLYKA